MSQTKLIIFDFDGVLREASWLYIYHAYKAFIEFRGKDPTLFFTDVSSFRKWSNHDWHKNEERIIGNEYNPNKTLTEFFHAHHDKRVTLYPWVYETMECLSKKYQLTILSSSSRNSVEGTLGELSRYFSFIAGSGEVMKLKPDSEGVFLILKETKTKASDALIVGDMDVDFLAGKNAGIKTGLVKWGLGDWGELSLLGADFFFEKPEELLKL